MTTTSNSHKGFTGTGQFVVRLEGFGLDHYITRGNLGLTATYATREEAQELVDKCPNSYRAVVVPRSEVK